MSHKNTVREFLANKRGEIIVWQIPNFLLWLWIIVKLLPLIIHDQQIKFHLSQLSKAVLFAWAYLELTQGDSKFRKVLGFVVLVATVLSIFS